MTEVQQPSLNTFYCLRNKCNSEYENPEEKINKRNVKYISATCKTCGKLHNKFLKSDKNKKDINQTELTENLEIIQPVLKKSKTKKNDEEKPKIKKPRVKKTKVEDVIQEVKKE